jgi:hypothetical protein
MKLWDTRYDEGEKHNFPQIVYKNRLINIEEETFLTNKLFNLFLLTHRDKHTEIKIIQKDKTELPYRKLSNLIIEMDLEFETEYMVHLLNYFNIEVD